VAQNCSLAAGEDSSHETFVMALWWVPHRVDPLMNSVQMPFANPDRDCFRSQAARFELPPRDRTMLASGNFSRSPIGRVEFCVHMDA